MGLNDPSAVKTANPRFTSGWRKCHLALVLSAVLSQALRKASAIESPAGTLRWSGDLRLTQSHGHIHKVDCPVSPGSRKHEVARPESFVLGWL